MKPAHPTTRAGTERNLTGRPTNLVAVAAEFAARRFRDRWAPQQNVKLEATVRVTGARESLLAKLEQIAGADAVDPELAVEANDVTEGDAAAPGRRIPHAADR